MDQRLSSCYLLLWWSFLLQAVEGVLHPGEPPRQRQQQAHHLVQVAHEHAELVELVGLTEALHGGLHLAAQSLVVLHVLLQAVSRLPQHLQLPGQAGDQLLLQTNTNRALKHELKLAVSLSEGEFYLFTGEVDVQLVLRVLLLQLLLHVLHLDEELGFGSRCVVVGGAGNQRGCCRERDVVLLPPETQTQETHKSFR